MMDIPEFKGGWSYTQKEMTTLPPSTEFKNS